MTLDPTSLLFANSASIVMPRPVTNACSQGFHGPLDSQSETGIKLFKEVSSGASEFSLIRIFVVIIVNCTPLTFFPEDHYYLLPDDDWLFLGEYTARAGYSFSVTNDLILNFKKSFEKEGLPEWPYKERAIQQAPQCFHAALLAELDTLTFVPIPPSKAKDNPLYDARMIRRSREYVHSRH